MKTLLDLYKSHTGKVSDKWALYLREYDRLFAPYRDQPISMLEIGVQNGGSLEIWSQYFPNAQKFVGCDINPDCAQLRYEDPRIAVIVGDASAPKTQAKVLEQSASFDLIIEDGSHTSSDIVKAFARYFPALKTGGLFVAEDLHCSYWQEYEGGIFHPYSSITFFKHLADMVNHEHWGVEKNRTDLIAGFKQLLEIDLEEEILSQISSIEFINSICIIRKKETIENLLGTRNVAGLNSEVVPTIRSLANAKSEPLPQTANVWSTLKKSPAETYQDLVHEINQTKDLVGQLRNEIETKKAEVAHLSQLVSAMQGSRSWRYTAALRQTGNLARPAVKLLRRIKSAAGQNGGYAVLARKVINVMRREGWQGLRWRMSNAQTAG
ncbi:MAG: class I SAM-dependent methyltransferase, partial [Betaproteobacteria bacterium]